MSRKQRREQQRRRSSAIRSPAGRGRLATGAGISLAAALSAPAAAQATDFTVTTTGDPTPGSCDLGDCSLREAVLEAEGNATDDRILFQAAVTGTITLTNGQLDVTKPLEVVGPGAPALTVFAGTGARIFDIDTAPTDPVTISGLTLTGANIAGAGAAIFSQDAELTVRNATISGNTAANSGGGIYSRDSTTTIESSTIEGNSSTCCAGGGLFSFSNNATITSSTISGNDANYGGGVDVFNGTITIESSTIAGNDADVYGGGVASSGAAPDPSFLNTIVAGNTSPDGPDVSNGAGSDEFNAGFSLIGSTSGATVNETFPGSLITGESAQLGVLADNGGPTETRAPAFTSPVVDTGAGPTPSEPGPFDQRGLTRPVDLAAFPNSTAPGANGADMGAVELQLPSNAFTLGALKRHRRKGTATLSVTVPGAGRLVLGGAKVKAATKNAGGAGIVKLLIRAKGRAAKRLRRTGRAKVRAKVTFTPTAPIAGIPRTQSRKVRLVKR